MNTANLLPEDHLLSSLSPLWRKRFERAVKYLQDNIDQTPFPTWEEIAGRCAISPYHFHRMFKLVFHETPGEYVKRTRLLLAIHFLIDQPEMKITEVALTSGFSSSQALAKSLRRDLNTSAKAIRKISKTAAVGNTNELESLLFRLGHSAVDKEHCLEKTLAESITFEIKHFPKKKLYLEEMSLTELWTKDLKKGELDDCDEKELYILTSAEEFIKPYSEQKILVGCPISSALFSNFTLEVDKYLCCRIKVNNEVAYIAAWDALYRKLLTSDLEFSDQGYAVDIIHDPEELQNDEASEMTLCLPIKE